MLTRASFSSWSKNSLRNVQRRSWTAVTSKVELFVIIKSSSFQPLTIITKSSTLDVATVRDPPLMLNYLEVFIDWVSTFLFHFCVIKVLFHTEVLISFYFQKSNPKTVDFGLGIHWIGCKLLFHVLKHVYVRHWLFNPLVSRVYQKVTHS